MEEDTYIRLYMTSQIYEAVPHDHHQPVLQVQHDDGHLNLHLKQGTKGLHVYLWTQEDTL